MTDSFESWINSMSDAEYEDMLNESNEDGFTNAQRSNALNIREAPDLQELEQLELEQEFRGETVAPASGTVTGERIGEEQVVEPSPTMPIPTSPIPPDVAPRARPPKPPKPREQIRSTIDRKSVV